MKKYITMWLTALLVSVSLTTLASETPDRERNYSRKNVRFAMLLTRKK